MENLNDKFWEIILYGKYFIKNILLENTWYKNVLSDVTM